MNINEAFNKHKNIILISFLTVLLVIIAWFFGLKDLFHKIELLTYDWRAQIAVDKGPMNQYFNPADKDIIIVSADNYTFDQLHQHSELGIGRWPWPRRSWGEILNYISQGNPKAVVFDIKFEGVEGNYTSQKSSDEYFAKQLKANKDKVILGIALSSARAEAANQINMVKQKYDLTDREIDEYIVKLRKSNTPVHKESKLKLDESYIQTLGPDKYNKLINNITFYKQTAVPQMFLDNIRSIGVVNLSVGKESKVRYNVPVYKLITAKDSGYIPSLPLATVLSLIPEEQKKLIKFNEDSVEFGSRKIAINDKGEALLNWHGASGSYRYIHASDVLISNAVQSGKIKKPQGFTPLSPEIFKDKIIVLGETKGDVLSTTMEMVYPGPEIIATAIDNYLNDADMTNLGRRKFITKMNSFITGIIAVLLSALIVIVNIRTKNYINSFIIFILMLLMFTAFSILIFVHPNIRIWINMTYPILFMVISMIASYLVKINLEQSSKKVVEGLFGKFVSPQVLDKLLEHPDAAMQGNQRKYMTVLFSDIRNFTTLSETIDANILIPQINEYFNEVVEAILENEGTMDKFIGDAVMAFWGDPLPVENHEYKAVKTAVNILERLEILNQKWKVQGKTPIDIGIGVHTGDMLVGYMGSDKIVDYTVVGDNVNLASRIESLCKEYKSRILISESTHNEVKSLVDSEYVDEVTVKGKQIPHKIFKIKGLK